MRLSSRGDYGLRAILDLATLYEAGRPVQVHDIAARQDVPEDYLGQLMVALRKAGLVESVRGPSGGYILSRPPSEITLTQALEALEGPMTETECGPQEKSKCSQANACALREALEQANQAALAVLNSITIESIRRRQSEMAGVLTYQI